MQSGDYEDDPEISPEELLYRRIPGDDINWKPSEQRPTSAAFGDSRDDSPMSVALGSLLSRAQMKPDDLLKGYDRFGLVRFTAANARAQGLAVAIRPPRPGEPAHGWVVGNKTHACRKRLKACCEVVVAPS